ncbi:putative thymidylate kinase [Paenibacillus sp. TCA20]|uniref:Thymidylate kinase n=1 Tax=Paenibacillus urinalis TaxID=521520 RepID=A0ABY7XN12_9BACL|nr:MULTISPECIES: dTMP kinase [Paenibacillus]WDI05040.1 dTMP kinase [Paenibacillus urinalis]GAK42134.1 putative thymidylate kinase [Paenibacillus sp. TCA20]
MKKMFIIALEGLDKSGKATQAKLLTEALREKGLKVEQSEFHRYDTPTGELIAKWLRKEYPVSQATIELIMAADKHAQQEYFNELEAAGVDVLILDRYTLSQFVYGIVNEMPYDWCEKLQELLRKPDMDIVIEIPPELSMERKGKHNGGVNDRYESDLNLLHQVSFAYRIFRRKDHPIIDGNAPIEDVHEEIKKEVIARLKDEDIL